MTNLPPNSREKIFEQIAELYTDSDLWAEVVELKLQEATDINNGGVGKQLDYLEKSGGLDWLIEYFLGGPDVKLTLTEEDLEDVPA